jgi:crotonobetainyl-CoA:carnitine CoA-transferase CaiB-like acyl-CoA transferase
MASGPLSGIRIVDLTHVWAGPLGTRILADLGAEVVKIEAATARGPLQALPGVRGMYPHDEPGQEPWNRQGVFNKLNRNKKSLCLNLKTDAGRQLFLDLVAASDVVIENFSAATMRSLGLDYAALKTANPHIIYVAMPGHGTCGPYRDFVAYGASVEPMTGLTSLMGYTDQEPRTTAIALPDAAAGVTAAAAVVTALYKRVEEGVGGYIDLSMQEAAISLIGEYVLEQQITGRQPAVRGNGHACYAPHGTYRCQGDDHWIVIACRNQSEWEAFCQLANQGWEKEPRYATIGDRREHQTALDDAIHAWTQGWDKIELMTALQQRGVPAGAVMNTPEFMRDPHLSARGFFVALGGEHIEAFPYPGSPVLIDGARGDGWCCAPKLGEHNEEILQQLLGFDDSEVQRLIDQGVLANRPPA